MALETSHEWIALLPRASVRGAARTHYQALADCERVLAQHDITVSYTERYEKQLELYADVGNGAIHLVGRVDHPHHEYRWWVAGVGSGKTKTYAEALDAVCRKMARATWLELHPFERLDDATVGTRRDGAIIATITDVHIEREMEEMAAAGDS